MASESNGSEITVVLKTPKVKHTFKLSPDMTIEELRQKAASEFKATIERIVLIFSGKILKDADTLKTHNILDGHTVHVVIKMNNTTASKSGASTAKKTSGSTPAAAAPQQQQSPNNPGGPQSNSGLGGMFASMGGGSMAEMQRNLLNNPEAMQSMMQNPMMQSMMSNPDLIHEVMMSNPHMRDMVERNPEVGHILNNPELMQQTLEMARNPAMMQEMMRNQDRAMSNLESLPGGYNALQRMYTEYQEPMMNAAQEQFGRNPFAALANNGTNENSEPQNTENTEPLPNPWASNARQGGNSTTRPSSNANQGSKNSSSANTGNANPLNSMAGMFNTPAMQNVMNQVSQNPEMMSSMMNSPYVQSMMQDLTSNPDMAQQILSGNPMFANNPNSANLLPQVLEQMQRPGVMNAITNPRAMEAMRQVQQGLQTLQQEAPEVFPNGIPGFPGAAATGTANTATSTPAADGGAPPASNAGGAGAVSNADFLRQMMENLMGNRGGAGGASAASQEPPETRFSNQLEQLANMGFNNQEQNIRALLNTNGNVNQAVEMLLR